MTVNVSVDEAMCRHVKGFGWTHLSYTIGSTVEKSPKEQYAVCASPLR